MLPAPATRAVIYSAAKTVPAPADAGPPGLAALKITASCGRKPVAPVTLTAFTGPFPPGRWQCARQSLPHPSRHTPHFAQKVSQAGSQPTHPTCSPPPSQGAAPVQKARPVTDAKEVGVGNATEETFRHRADTVFPKTTRQVNTAFQLTARAASAAPPSATSSRRDTGAHRRRRHRRRRPHQHPLSAHLQADLDHAASPAASQPADRTVDG
jgi:hypothetical protein